MTKALVQTADPKETDMLESAQGQIKTIAALKRRANTTTVTWALAIRYAHAEDFDQLCIELNGLCEEMLVGNKTNKECGSVTDIHIKPDSGNPL